MSVSLAADDETNPLLAYSDLVAGKAPSGNDTMGLSAVDSPDDPASVHQLSQQAFDKMQGIEPDAETDETAPDSETTTTSGGGGSGGGSGGASTGAPSGGGGSGVTDVGQVPTDNIGSSNYGSPAGGNFVTDDATTAQKIVQYAKSVLGHPYVWGGNTRAGLDCSGLVQQAYLQAGIEMPRLSNYQMNKGKITKYGDLKPGDLVGWNNSNHVVGADHIAIYIGNNQIIEAPRPGTNIRVAGLYDYDTAQMWAVRIPGKHVGPQVQAPVIKAPTKAAGSSTRAVEAASAASPKPKKKPAPGASSANEHSTGSHAVR